MKFVKIVYHIQFNAAILDLIKKLDIHQYVDCQRICAEDENGKHFGDKIWPGLDCVLSVPVTDEKAEELFNAVIQFKQSDPRKKHIRILILPVEKAG